MGYFSIHNHTDYSSIRLIDSINRVEPLIDRAIELGLSGICITEHEALCSHVQAIQHMKEVGNQDFKLGLGDEIYLVNDIEDVSELGYTHFILLAKDKIGHRALREISSTAWENSRTDRGMLRVPTSKKTLKSIVEKYKGHLIGTSACLGSELSKLVLMLIANEDRDHYEKINETKGKIVEHISYCKDVFGEDFYIEVQPAAGKEQHLYNLRVKSIAKALGVKMVFTTDSHFLKREDRAIHKAYLNSKEAEREVDDFYATAYLMSEDEAWSYLKNEFTRREFSDMIDNTNEIRDKIETYDLFQPQIIPEVKIDLEEVKLILEKYKHTNLEYVRKMIDSTYEQDKYWIGKVLIGYEEKTLTKPYLNQEVYLNRINEEAYELWNISIKLKNRMTKYYNTMSFLIKLMWDAGAMVGIARGSATAYLTNYYLDIIQLDPVHWDLPHWRHLSAERPELADIDVDTPASKRGAVLQATIDYFGEENVLNIATFGTEGGKSAVLTACRGLGIDSDTAQFLSGLIPIERGKLWELKDVVYGNEEKDRKSIPMFVEEMKKHKGLLEVSLYIEGLVNKRSIHASGVYIYNNGYLDHNAMMKAPNGQRISQFNMGDSDYMGSLKYDYLTIEALDKMSACMDFLLKEGIIEDQGSLKKNYDKYIHPDVLELNSRELWDKAGRGEVLDLFQFSTAVGLDAIKKIKPTNLVEAAHANSLMRLMAEKDAINPVDKYILFRDNLSLWYAEMAQYSLTKEEVSVLEKYLKPYCGVSATQEDVMRILMDEKVCGLNVKDVNKVRKAIAKKKANLLEEAHTMIKNACTSDNLVRYIWDKVVMPQAGYAFSIAHTTPYTGIALQELALYSNYNSIYWNTACLAVNSGSADEDIEGKATDYGKIAKAIGEIKQAGITVSLLDINKSDFGFKPDTENNEILFGLKGVNSVGDDLVKTIIANRPYESMSDFLTKVKPNKQAMISLIKGGAFDKLEKLPRKKVMFNYLWNTCDKKKRLTLQNFNGLLEANLLPKELDFQKRVFVFNKFLKANCSVGSNYAFTDNAMTFYSSFYDTDHLEVIGSKPCIDKKIWDDIYKKEMSVAREYIKSNHDKMLSDLNTTIFKEEWNKYALGSVSAWEMESLCFYHDRHELEHIDINKYGISNFSDLPEEPEVDYYFKKGGREIPIYKLSKIIGTCIDKNKTKSTVTILTTDGVVDVKFRSEYFAIFDKQLSETQQDGTKKIVEKSWFGRGNMIMLTGMRRGDQFIPKKYSKTPTHQLYKIEEITEEGDMVLSCSRYGAE